MKSLVRKSCKSERERGRGESVKGEKVKRMNESKSLIIEFVIVI